MELEELIRNTLHLGHVKLSDSDGPGSFEEWDSLGHVSVIDAIEDGYGIEISDDDMANIRTISDIKKLIT